MDAKNRNNNARSLIISDFRNLGVSALRKSKSDKTILKINRSLEKDELGGLVIILGGNNIGKSNVLDAVAKCTEQEFDEETDYTDFIPMPKKPTLTLDVAGGIYGEITPPKISLGTGKYKVIGTVPDVLLYIFRQKESFELFNKWKGQSKEKPFDDDFYLYETERRIRRLISDTAYPGESEVYAYILRNREELLGEDVVDIANAIEGESLSRYAKDRLEVLVKGTPIDDVTLVEYKRTPDGTVPFYVRNDKLDAYMAEKRKFNIFRRKKLKDPSEDVMITDLSGGVKDTEVIPDKFSNVYGYNLSNRIYKYEQHKIRNSDLTTDPQKPNDFMTKVFALLGYENKSIVNRYYDNPNIRVRLEEDLNKELKSVSEKLNRLLNSVEKKYDLHIRLEKSEIVFSIFCGDKIGLNLDHQSEGFRWIFEFFVNFLMSKKFVAGDIVIIDEFGGLLNLGTVAELTGILREFAKKHGITFVMASQNPMAVDITHLDEVRMIVPKPNGGTDILNDFPQFGNGECMDVLKPIVSSLTVGRNYMRSEKRTTVFVENYRDYFYLNGFNSIMGYDLDFIPVNGITEYTSPEQFAGALKAIEHDPVLLADESAHNAEFIEKLDELGIGVYTIAEITGGVKSVPELFAESDAERLSSTDASFDEAASISYAIATDEQMDDETQKNFQTVLDYISLG